MVNNCIQSGTISGQLSGSRMCAAAGSSDCAPGHNSFESACLYAVHDPRGVYHTIKVLQYKRNVLSQMAQDVHRHSCCQPLTEYSLHHNAVNVTKQ